MSWSKGFLLKFIDEFQKQEVLWKVKHKDYHNKQKRLKALEILLNVIKKIDPCATVNTVTKKINNLRTVFRKELHKIASGASDSEAQVHVPKLWYFESLSFLLDQEQPSRRTKRSIGSTCEDEGALFTDFSSPTESFKNSKSDVQECITFKRKKSARSDMSITDKTIEPIVKLSETSQDDKFDIFGKHISHKLRSLPESQKIFAEKFINDVIFEAEMGTLHRGCSVHVTPLPNIDS